MNGAAPLMEMSHEELENLFRNSLPGEIPVGRGQGTVLFLPGTALAAPMARLFRLLFWQGKVFDPEHSDLRNLVSPFGVKAVRARVYGDRSWFDDKDCIVLDYSKTSRAARWIRDEIREVVPGVYLGLVFWGNRHVLKFTLAF